MTGYGDGEHDNARRFRDTALPFLDDVFTLARYLMRNASDAEDAVQEYYLRAPRSIWLLRRSAISGRRSCGPWSEIGRTFRPARSVS
jgi:DNA-directed RNA polymerase specialized sigma24 family protein